MTSFEPKATSARASARSPRWTMDPRSARVLARGTAMSALAPTMEKPASTDGEIGKHHATLGARCVVGALGAAAWGGRLKVPGSAAADPTVHTLVRPSPALLRPQDDGFWQHAAKRPPRVSRERRGEWAGANDTKLATPHQPSGARCVVEVPGAELRGPLVNVPGSAGRGSYEPRPWSIPSPALSRPSTTASWPSQAPRDDAATLGAAACRRRSRQDPFRPGTSPPSRSRSVRHRCRPHGKRNGQCRRWLGCSRNRSSSQAPRLRAAALGSSRRSQERAGPAAAIRRRLKPRGPLANVIATSR
jgi:hypothetical protein